MGFLEVGIERERGYCQHLKSLGVGSARIQGTCMGDAGGEVGNLPVLEQKGL